MLVVPRVPRISACLTYLAMLAVDWCAAVELLGEDRLRLLGPYRPTIEPLLRKLLTREPHRRPLLSGVAHLVTRAIASVPVMAPQ